MIDLEKIGKRIYEQRKHIMHISQEKFAEDLFMYQADVSNLEKAKKGSGITDLCKLEMIADYFGIPLETLLFGREDKNMLKYYGNSMNLKKSRKKVKKNHQTVLMKLMDAQEPFEPTYCYECGPYTVYVIMRVLQDFCKESEQTEGPVLKEFYLPKARIFVFYGVEIIAHAVADISYIMQHVFKPALKKLQSHIPPEVLDPVDVWRTLNPYWALWQFSINEKNPDEFYEPMLERMDELRQHADTSVIYVESVYVREDSRQNGICRLCLDTLRELYPDAIIWMNMEPTSGEELQSEVGHFPSYSLSDVGQLNINAAIAEKLGLTVDSGTWHRQAESIDENGEIAIKTVLVRKCAYFIPKHIKEILKNDEGFVEKGRAIQKIKGTSKPNATIEVNHKQVGDDFIYEIKFNDGLGRVYHVSAVLNKAGNVKYVISYGSLLRDTKIYPIAEFDSLEDAVGTEYEADVYSVKTMLSAVTAYKYLENGDKVLVPMQPDSLMVTQISTKVEVDHSENCIYGEIEFLAPNHERLFAFGEKTSDGERYAIAAQSILEAFLNNDEDDEIETKEEYYTYEGTDFSDFHIIFIDVHDALVEKWKELS